MAASDSSARMIRPNSPHRLTNAFSKNIDNRIHALAIYFMFDNFVRIHRSARVAPAMGAGVAEKFWDLTEIVRMEDAHEAAPVEAATGNAGLARLRGEADSCMTRPDERDRKGPTIR